MVSLVQIIAVIWEKFELWRLEANSEADGDLFELFGAGGAQDILMSTDSIVCGRRRGAYDSQCFPYVYFLEA
jgi:hypothetical protein